MCLCSALCPKWHPTSYSLHTAKCTLGALHPLSYTVWTLSFYRALWDFRTALDIFCNRHEKSHNSALYSE